VKVWRYKRQNRTSYRTSQQCEGVKIQTTEQNIVSDITTVWRCEDTKDRTEHRIRHHNSVKVIFTPSHCCDVRYDVLFCLLYLHTFTLLWCPIRCSVLSFVSSHLHTVVMSDTMFCSVVCIFTPSHCCDVRYDVLFCRFYHHTFKLLWCLIRCSLLSFVSSHLHTVVMSAGYSIRVASFFFNSTVSYTYNHCAGTVDYRDNFFLEQKFSFRVHFFSGTKMKHRNLFIRIKYTLFP
jgi:hypothetical protein